MNISKLKLNMAMAKKGYNFVALAGVSGVSRNTLSAINNGKACKPVILFKVAKALEMKPEELLEV